MIPLAHFGHWYVQLIFASPVLVLGGAMLVATLRDRSRRRRERDGEPELEPPTRER